MTILMITVNIKVANIIKLSVVIILLSSLMPPQLITFMVLYYGKILPCTCSHR